MYAIRQTVKVKEGSCIAAALGAGEFQVNSLHRQAIGVTAPRLTVEAVAEDGTIEAVSGHRRAEFRHRRAVASGILGESDATSARLFKSFGDAVRAYAEAKGR